MPTHTRTEHNQQPDNIKAVKRSIMDDAPLFAGLDDFVLNQSVKMEEKGIQTSPPKEKNKTATRKTKQAAAIESPSQPVTKKPKTAAVESGAVLLSVTEICALLKISRATLIRMDKAGKLPGRIKLGGSVRFHRETIDAWLQSLISTHAPL